MDLKRQRELGTDGRDGRTGLRGGQGFDTASYAESAAGVTVNLALTTAQDTGGSGRDLLNSIEAVVGSNCDDRLAGSAKADRLAGGSGNDRLTGGTGVDTFRFAGTPDGATNVDLITDFVPVDDRIELENTFFTRLATTGALAPGLLAANADGLARDANDFLVYETDTGRLLYDADGHGAASAVQIALLAGAPPLTAADLFVT